MEADCGRTCWYRSTTLAPERFHKQHDEMTPLGALTRPCTRDNFLGRLREREIHGHASRERNAGACRAGHRHGRVHASLLASGRDFRAAARARLQAARSEEHTSELQSLMRISYAVFCLKKKTSKK